MLPEEVYVQPFMYGVTLVYFFPRYAAFPVGAPKEFHIDAPNLYRRSVLCAYLQVPEKHVVRKKPQRYG